MNTILHTTQVGPYAMNAYAVIDPVTKKSAIIDPGGDPDTIVDLVAGTKVEKILITHGHHDHVMALEEVKAITRAPVYIHSADAYRFKLAFDEPLQHGLVISLGEISLVVIHVPGHTPGQCCFNLGDNRMIVGDTIFVGGPGKTESHQDFITTIKSMREIVFQWPDETLFFPGHGPSGLIGEERPDFEAFITTAHLEDLYGDITWK